MTGPTTSLPASAAALGELKHIFGKQVAQTPAEALAKLSALPHIDLADICSESHKDFHGVKGRWMYDYSMAQLVAWFTTYFRWDVTAAEGTGAWVNKVEFGAD